MQTRKQAFRNPNEEYQRILDVMMKYSIRFGDSKVSFTCKKQGQGVPDLHTQANSSTANNISTAYGFSVARELIDIEISYESVLEDDSATEENGETFTALSDNNGATNPSTSP